MRLIFSDLGCGMIVLHFLFSCSRVHVIRVFSLNFVVPFLGVFNIK